MIFYGFFSLYPYQKAVHGYLALHPGNPIGVLPVMPITQVNKEPLLRRKKQGYKSTWWFIPVILIVSDLLIFISYKSLTVLTGMNHQVDISRPPRNPQKATATADFLRSKLEVTDQAIALSDTEVAEAAGHSWTQPRRMTKFCETLGISTRNISQMLHGAGIFTYRTGPFLG